MNIYHILFVLVCVSDVKIEKSTHTQTEKDQLKGQIWIFSSGNTQKKISMYANLNIWYHLENCFAFSAGYWDVC